MRNYFQIFLALAIGLFVSTAMAGTSTPGLVSSIKLSMPLAKTTRGNLQKFLRLTKPMAPLDLNVAISISPKYASKYKNFYFGAMAAAAGLSDTKTNALIKHFFAKYVTEAKSSGMERLAKSAEKLVQKIREYNSIHIIATWSRDAFRVNDTFITHDTITFYHCRDYDYIPCKNKNSIPLQLASAHTVSLLKPIRSLAAKMRKAGFVAVVKQPPMTPSGTRVIVNGLADNEVGLFVTKDPNGSMPSWFAGGKQVVYVQKIFPTVYWYETN